MKKEEKALSKIILVIGSGRSGTHWLGYILGAHPDVNLTVEKKPMFDWVVDMALYPDSRTKLMPKLVKRYKKEYAKSASLHYVDKSHPNIWIADELAKSLPNVFFVGVVRNPYATVASMLKHKAVLAWQENWKKFPIPNRFLGITVENAGYYDDLPVAVKCALRWRSHKEQMEHIEKTLGPRAKVFQYEKFVEDTEHQLQDLQNFIGLSSPIPSPPIKRESLDKWKYQLSVESQDQIAKVVGFGPTECN